MAREVSVVVPTVGRPSLAALLQALAGSEWEVLVVDDRGGGPPLTLPELPGLRLRVLTGPGGGPAAARNLGWRAASGRWVVFLDDDVVPRPGWRALLAADLRVPARVGGVQGRVVVPLPAGRRHTDWERNTAGLAAGRWITADMAYRRAALLATGGFDERFPRAYREDAELAHRVRCAGWELVRGGRTVCHPVRPADAWASLHGQRGNADDARLRRMYGRHWRALLQVPRGRRHRHAVTTASGATALLAATAAGRHRAAAIVAAVAATAWLAATAEFAAARIRPGPGNPREIATMLVTSALIPPLATGNWLRGWWSARGARPLRSFGR